MYRIKLFGNTGAGDPVTTFARAKMIGWSHRINAPGQMTFSLPWDDPQATDSYLQKYRAIQMLRKTTDGTRTYVEEWGGYIEAHKRVDDSIEVYCQGTLQFFRHRYTDANQTFTGEASADASDLLDQTNGSDGDTGVTFGAGGVTTTQNIKIDAQDILRAWEQMGLATGGEFEIDPSRVFNFVPLLGEDKSSIVTLIFKRDGSSGSNMSAIDDGEDGADMANKVIGFSSASGGLTSTKQNLTSQATYGVLVERKQFDYAQDQATLDAMTQTYVDQKSNPITDFRVSPILSQKRFNTLTGDRHLTKLKYDDISVGDLVSVKIKTRNKTVNTAKRIAEIIVNVDENGAEKILYTLSQAGVYITASMFDGFREIQELKRQVKEIQGVLS